MDLEVILWMTALAALAGGELASIPDDVVWQIMLLLRESPSRASA
jgi:hypothetical protein